jgi:hypothetical protein
LNRSISDFEPLVPKSALEPLDALRRPLGADLVARHAPHLLGVGLEEGRVEATPEAVDHPLLERLLLGLWPRLGREVAEDHPRALGRPHLREGVERLEGVLDEPSPVVDAREPRDLEEALLEHLVPDAVDLLDLRVEAVAADVEAEPVVRLGAGDAADPVAGLQNDRLDPASDQLVAGAQSGRSSPDDDDLHPTLPVP